MGEEEGQVLRRVFGGLEVETMGQFVVPQIALEFAREVLRQRQLLEAEQLQNPRILG